MIEIAAIEAQIVAEWAMISGAPTDFLAALIVGWLAGWFFIRAWYRREIRNLGMSVKLVESERDIERRQKEGLRKVILELKPSASVLAMEIGYGDTDVQKVVEKLAQGDTVQTVNPIHSSGLLIFPARVTTNDIKQIAATVYTTSTGLSQVIKSDPQMTVFGGTLTTQSVNAVSKSFKKLTDEK